MMCLVPLVHLDEKKIKISYLLPIVVAIFVWGNLSYQSVLAPLKIPKTSGLNEYSGVTLFGVYIAGRLYNLWKLNIRMRCKYVIIMFVVLLVFAAIGMNEYNNLISVLLSACGFYLFSHIPFKFDEKSIFTKVILFLSSSTFSVYLLHQPQIGLMLDYVKQYVDSGWNIYFCYFIVAIIVFLLSIVVDIPRRIIIFIANKPIKWCLDKIDNLYFDILEYLENIIQKQD